MNFNPFCATMILKEAAFSLLLSNLIHFDIKCIFILFTSYFFKPSNKCKMSRMGKKKFQDLKQYIISRWFSSLERGVYVQIHVFYHFGKRLLLLLLLFC